MPLSVFHSVRNSRTPDEYLDLILDAVRNNYWSYPEPTRTETEELWSSSGVKRLIFQGKKSGRSVSLQIDRIELRKPFAVKKHGKSLLDPRLRLSKNVLVLLNETAWQRAARISRIVKDVHPSNDGSGSIAHTLLFPAGLFGHWTEARYAEDKLIVPADDAKIEELRKYEKAAAVVRGYLDTIDFMRGREGMYPDKVEAYERRTGVKRIRPVQELSGLSGIDRFIVANREHHDFFRELAAISRTNKREEKGFLPLEKKMLRRLSSRHVAGKPRTEKKVRKSMKEAIRKAIVTHFGIPKSEFVNFFAEQVEMSFENPGNQRHAKAIGEKTQSRTVVEGVRKLEERRRR